jgi:hypothetical protein
MTPPPGRFASKQERPFDGGGIRGWLRLAGGDNAIGMIWGDLVGSEQFRGAQTCQQ